MTLQSTDPTAGRVAPSAGAAGRGAQTLAPGQEKTKISPVLVLFLIALTTPTFFSVGGLHLSPLRVLLVVMVVPLVIDWLRTGYGKFLFTDFALLAFSLWVFVALLANHGLSRLEFFGITMIEIIAPYLLARKYVQNTAQFRKFVFVMVAIMLFCIPGGFMEATTATQIYKPIFKLFGNVFYWRLDPRMGMFRAQVGFEHPILYGVFCASTFGLFYFTTRRAPGKTGIYGPRLAIVSGLATFFSLSVGAFIGVIIQIYLIIWNRVMRNVKNKWMILGSLVAAAYVTVDVLSTRTPFEVFISYLTFNSDTSYWRILIFKFGIDDVWGSPLVGIGLNDWTRPHWMQSASVDNFWLLTAMRYGIPGFVLIFIAYISAITHLARAKGLSEEVANQRLGLTIVMVAIGVSMCTVHLWGASFVHFCFLLGVGSWFSVSGASTGASMGEEAENTADPAGTEPETGPVAGPMSGTGAETPYPYARPRSALGLKTGTGSTASGADKTSSDGASRDTSRVSRRVIAPVAHSRVDGGAVPTSRVFTPPKPKEHARQGLSKQDNGNPRGPNKRPR